MAVSSELVAAVLRARTAPDILAALARLAWSKAHGTSVPGHAIPSETDPCAWFDASALRPGDGPENPATWLAEADSRLEAVDPDYADRLPRAWSNSTTRSASVSAAGCSSAASRGFMVCGCAPAHHRSRSPNARPRAATSPTTVSRRGYGVSRRPYRVAKAAQGEMFPGARGTGRAPCDAGAGLVIALAVLGVLVPGAVPLVLAVAVL